MTEAEFLAALATQARELRATIDALHLEEPALTTRAERLQADYAAASGEAGRPAPDAEELHAKVSKASSRLRALPRERQEAERALAEVDRLLGAEAAESAALKDIDQTTQAIGSAQREVQACTEGIIRMQMLRAVELQAAQAARASAAASALASLPEDVRETLGVKTPDPNQPVGDPSAHDQRAKALEEAEEKTAQTRDCKSEKVAMAESAKRAAVKRLAEARAYRAEVRHSAAMVTYVRALSEWRVASEIAFEVAPFIPNFKQIVDQTHAAAKAEALASLEPKQDDDGLLKRGIKRLAGAVGL